MSDSEKLTHRFKFIRLLRFALSWMQDGGSGLFESPSFSKVADIDHSSVAQLLDLVCHDMKKTSGCCTCVGSSLLSAHYLAIG
jgi:hypothetical protein